MTKNNLLLPSIFLMILHLACGIVDPSSDVKKVIWQKSDSPILITERFLVKKGQTLLIEPGVEVKLKALDQQGNLGWLHIQGTLIAEGSKEDSIRFTRQGDVGRWGRILFDGSKNVTNSLKYCKIEHSSSQGRTNETPSLNGLVTFYESHGTLSNTALKGQGQGVVINCTKSSDLVIEENEIDGDEGHIGISVQESSDILVHGNIIDSFETGISSFGNTGLVISGNTISGSRDYAIKVLDKEETVVTQNIISGGNTGIFCETNTMTDISSNKISNCWRGIWLSPNSDSKIINNEIKHCDQGIACFESSPIIIGNLIVGLNLNNHAAISLTDSSNALIANNTISTHIYGIFAAFGANPQITNTLIMCPNPISSQSALPTLSYSLIENGRLLGPITVEDNNILGADPVVVSVAEGNYRLTQGSPCIDAGNSAINNLPALDIDGNDRIQGSSIDIGAFEYQN